MEFGEARKKPIVWTFGQATAAPAAGTFIAYDNYFVDGVYSVWRDNETQQLGTPSVWVRTDLGTLNFHPGPSDYSIIRFTAPLTSSYSYDIDFTSIDQGSKDVLIYHNGTLLFSDTIAGTASVSDINTLTLTAGDTLDMVVGNDGAFQFDGTQASFVIQTVPEPGSVALIGVGALLLFGRRRR